jgi:hypothetical protein
MIAQSLDAVMPGLPWARIGILERDTVPCSETCFGHGPRIGRGLVAAPVCAEGAPEHGRALLPPLGERGSRAPVRGGAEVGRWRAQRARATR